MKMLKEKREIEVKGSININLKLIIMFLGIVIAFPVFSQNEVTKELEFKMQLQGKWEAKNYTNNWRIMHYKPKQFYSIEFFDSTFVLKTIADSNFDTSTITGKWHYIQNFYGYRYSFGITMDFPTSSRNYDSTIIPCISCFLFNGLHTDVWEIRKIKKNYLFAMPILTGLEGQFSKPYKFKFKKVK